VDARLRARATLVRAQLAAKRGSKPTPAMTKLVAGLGSPAQIAALAALADAPR
jgi:hypothetical protein